MKTTLLVVVGLLTVSLAGCTGSENRAGLGQNLPVAGDDDGDRVPDTVEQILCGRELTAQALQAIEGAGRCASNEDYVPPLVDHDFFVPTVPTLGADADADGVPSTLRLEGLRVRVSTAAGASLVATTPTTLRQISVDPDDRDANTPIQSVITSPLVPMGVKPGADGDRDGFPRDVEVMRVEVSFDRRVHVPSDLNPPLPESGVASYQTPISIRQADSKFLDVDPDDANAQDPVASSVTVEEPIPTDVKMGPDGDRDDIPSTIIITFGYLVVDRTGALPSTAATAAPYRFEPAGTQTEPVDPDDADEDNPLPVEYGPVSVPISATQNGDHDNDGIPGSITITFLDVVIDRRNLARAESTFGNHEKTTALDPDDGNRNDPVPLDAIDGDRDFLPDAVEPWICLLQDRNTPTDGRCVRADGSGADGSGNNYVPPSTGGWQLT